MKIALISCTKKKMDYPCKAEELYSKSTLFTYAYSYAKQISDKVYILSALHGLVDTQTVLKPYNYTLNNQKNDVKKAWAEKVFECMEKEFDLKNDELIVFAGENYRSFLIPLIKEKYGTKITIPLQGLGLGKQMHYLKEKTTPQKEIEREL